MHYTKCTHNIQLNKRVLGALDECNVLMHRNTVQQSENSGIGNTFRLEFIFIAEFAKLHYIKAILLFIN